MTTKKSEVTYYGKPGAGEVLETVEITPACFVDVDMRGRPVGVEVFSPLATLPEEANDPVEDLIKELRGHLETADAIGGVLVCGDKFRTWIECLENIPVAECEAAPPPRFETIVLSKPGAGITETTLVPRPNAGYAALAALGKSAAWNAVFKQATWYDDEVYEYPETPNHLPHDWFRLLWEKADGVTERDSHRCEAWVAFGHVNTANREAARAFERLSVERQRELLAPLADRKADPVMPGDGT